MASTLPKNIQRKIKRAVFKKADEFGYRECGRIESGRFLDQLVDDPEVGHVLVEYMAKEKVRTYIKDGVLNAYAKSLTQKALASSAPEETIFDAFGEVAAIIQEGKGKQNGLYVLRGESGSIYVLSSGMVLKWETALRKALDIIANEPNLTINNKAPFICLRLSMSGQSLTEADKVHIITALGAVGVNAVFCGL